MKICKNETFGERVRTARVQAGYTQEALAEIIGVSRTTVAKWEKDTAEPKLLHLACIAEVLNVSTDVLLGVRTSPEVSLDGLSTEACKALETFLREVKKDAR